jgi:hypothetical protein
MSVFLAKALVLAAKEKENGCSCEELEFTATLMC